jgi:hypothetical protein
MKGACYVTTENIRNFGKDEFSPQKLILSAPEGVYPEQTYATRNISLLTFVPGRQHLVPMFVAGRHIFLQAITRNLKKK